MHGSSDKVDELLAQLTLAEKCALLSGKNMWETLNLPRLGIQSLKTTDGPAGVRGAKWTDGSHTTFIPCGISLADPLWEAATSKILEDPFLTGVMATQYIQGIQSQGVGACMKHFVANDQETRRFNMDEKIDERTLRELYLKPFHMKLKADPWAVMTSYPKINGEHADMSRRLVHDILREEWAFDGLVISDWGGLNSTVASIRATTDLEMPGPPLRYGAVLEAAVESNEVSESVDIDPSVRRVLRTLERAGLLSEGAPQPAPIIIDGTNVQRDKEILDKPEFRTIAREAATAGIVLLKNQDSILPLEPARLQSLAIIGPNAKNPTAGGSGSAIVNPYYITTPYESLEKAARELNPEINIQHEEGILTHLHLPLLGNILTTPDGSTWGVQVDFYNGHNFEGEIVATTHWQNSMVYLMSDGDIPSSLKGKPYCFRALGRFTPTISGMYDFSLSNTGKATFFINNELFIDNRDWSQICANFMNCSSPDKVNSIYLEAGVTYNFRIDNVAVPPPTRPHDNTLFHRIVGVKVGVLIQRDEEAMMTAAIQAARCSEVAVVIVGHNNDTEREGCDRTSLSLPRGTDKLVEKICEVNPNTVVVPQTACAISMPWAQKASAIVHAWYQGQENGNALTDILLGHETPSGKLPVTFPHKLEDHGSHLWFPGDAVNDRAEYGEGVLVGYRWFDSHSIKPLWPFGYGLSYTTFEITCIQVEGNIKADGSQNAILRATVTNTGKVKGSEVMQAYMSPSLCIKDVPKAPQSLVGFEKVFLSPGESKTVSLDLNCEAVAWYDVEQPNKQWRVDSGIYSCFVGTSSRDIVSVLDIIVD
ncbi:glycoside hydrolase [Penicillium cf. viridicatum]|uniref:beta-glucosidase n=1 Tax=Penicillium cf. viridicatum TaxID=2972119 RepID=A0A9W9MJ40_9EURO|nr:glycoside hydrolase [Penicillium cf. viridicatum]KAJ5202276.1 glycoside hydrolase [Penicillium cf. viridicatum]